MGVPGGTSGKELACHCRRCKRPGFNPWVGKIPGVENGYLLQYFCLKNPMDRATGWATGHGVSKGWDMTERLSTSLAHVTWVMLKNMMLDLIICFLIGYAYCTYGTMYLYRHIYILHAYMSW